MHLGKSKPSTPNPRTAVFFPAPPPPTVARTNTKTHPPHTPHQHTPVRPSSVVFRNRRAQFPPGDRVRAELVRVANHLPQRARRDPAHPSSPGRRGCAVCGSPRSRGPFGPTTPASRVPRRRLPPSRAAFPPPRAGPAREPAPPACTRRCRAGRPRRRPRASRPAASLPQARASSGPARPHAKATPPTRPRRSHSGRRTYRDAGTPGPRGPGSSGLGPTQAGCAPRAFTPGPPPGTRTQPAAVALRGGGRLLPGLQQPAARRPRPSPGREDYRTSL
nr:basic proline-rich protein-like [Camelus dromedarius]